MVGNRLGRSDLVVTVLGCSGSYASPGNPCSGYLVQSQGAAVLLDCGPGVLGPLQEVISFDELTAIVITHHHYDHLLELPMIHMVYRLFHSRDFEQLPVVHITRHTHKVLSLGREYRHHPTVTVPLAQHGSKLRSYKIGRLLDMSQRSGDSPLPCRMITDESDITIGDQRWRFAETDHIPGTLAVRVDAAGGRSFAFSADTGPGWDFRSLGEGIDLAMCEATHSVTCENRSDKHMNALEAAHAAYVAGIQRLVVTHVAPCCDPDVQGAEAAAVFMGSVEVARPGLTLTVQR